MMWLTWRQHRSQLLVTLAALAVLTVLLVITGRRMWGTFADTGLADCLGRLSPDEFLDADADDCHGPAARFNGLYRGYQNLVPLLLVLPALIGLFLGAPLVAREVEHHTHRLVWTQGISRRRWAATKIGLVGGATVVLAVGYAVLASWWQYPLGRANAARFEYISFDMQGVAPIGYALFAVALGIFAGTVWGRTLPAMAATLFGFIGARVAVAYARPHFLPPHERRYPTVSERVANWMRGDWVISRNVYDAAGNIIAPNGDAECGLTGPVSPGDTCANVGSYNLQVFQPISRFWLFQCIEAGIFVAMAALLLYLAMRRIRRSIT